MRGFMAAALCALLQSVSWGACPSFPLTPGGPIEKRWQALGGCSGDLGDPVSPERRQLLSGGIYQDFERGQITVPPRWEGDPSASLAHFVLSAAVKGNTISVWWEDTAPYKYDFFQVRWDRDDHADAIEEQHENVGGVLGIGGHDPQQVETGGGSRGTFEIPAAHNGTYIIRVEGCDKSGLLGLSSTCRQGFSYPVYVDAGLITLPKLGPPPDQSGPPWPASPPYDHTDGSILWPAQQRLIFASKCANPDDLVEADGDHEGELKTDNVIAFLQSLIDPFINCGGDPNPVKRRQLVNDAIRKAKVVSVPGTEASAAIRLLVGGAKGGILGAALGALVATVLGGPLSVYFTSLLGAAAGAIIGAATTSPAGDYDMRMMGLIHIVYRFNAQLEPDTRAHIVHDLLTASGPASNRREYLWIAGLPTFIPESENHVLMTESARYITNNLIAWEYQKKSQVVPAEYDNDQNGMTDWILSHLQSFVRQDFYEYNARPYVFQSMQALTVLFEYAAGPGNPCWRSKGITPSSPPSRACDVKRGARIVMDYLAGRHAIANQGLRRSSPYRRQPHQRDYEFLFGHQSDGATWRYLTFTGGSDFFWNHRYGRLDWGVPGDMIYPLLGEYRVPLLIEDMMGETKGYGFFQRHSFERDGYRGVEIYDRHAEYTIASGGLFDAGRLSLLSSAENAWAQPTVLLPRLEGLDRRELVAIRGAREHPDRVNTCVADGFACGLNPHVPPGIPEACKKTTGNWTFLDFDGFSPGCTLKYGFFVVVYRQTCDTQDCKDLAGDDGTFGFFEVTPSRSGIDWLADRVLNFNQSWSYQSQSANVYHSGGRNLTFTFQPLRKDRLKWGMVSAESPPSSGTKFEQDITKWGFADGEAMRSSGDGCIIFDNRLMNQRLILDYTDAMHPRRARLPLAGEGAECRCPLPEACMGPRYQ